VACRAAEAQFVEFGSREQIQPAPKHRKQDGADEQRNSEPAQIEPTNEQSSRYRKAAVSGRNVGVHHGARVGQAIRPTGITPAAEEELVKAPSRKAAIVARDQKQHREIRANQQPI